MGEKEAKHFPATAPPSEAGEDRIAELERPRPGASLYEPYRRGLARVRSVAGEAARSAEQQVPGLAYVGERGARVADREANREAIIQPGG
jgi:hypothetical protein